VLKLTTVTIGGQAIAQVQNPKDLCACRWTDPGAARLVLLVVSNNGMGCAMSDGSVQLAKPSFSGPGWALLAQTHKGTCADPGITTTTLCLLRDPLQD
jgi:hypothetical protein